MTTTIIILWTKGKKWQAVGRASAEAKPGAFTRFWSNSTIRLRPSPTPLSVGYRARLIIKMILKILIYLGFYAGLVNSPMLLVIYAYSLKVFSTICTLLDSVKSNLFDFTFSKRNSCALLLIVIIIGLYPAVGLLNDPNCAHCCIYISSY